MVIGHDAIGVAKPTLLLYLAAKALQEAPPVLLVNEDIAAFISAGSDVINLAGKFETKRAGPWAGYAPF